MYKTVIIDDIVLVRDAIKLLGQWDLFGISQIFEAGNAQDGLDIILRENPDLIITDMKMPVMDGVQLLKKFAYSLGFSNGNYLSKVFKKNEGVSPRDYRNGNISENR